MPDHFGRRGKRGFIQFDRGGYGMQDRDQFNHGEYGVNNFPRPGRRGGGGGGGRFDWLRAQYGLE